MDELLKEALRARLREEKRRTESRFKAGSQVRLKQSLDAGHLGTLPAGTIVHIEGFQTATAGGEGYLIDVKNRGQTLIAVEELDRAAEAMARTREAKRTLGEDAAYARKDLQTARMEKGLAYSAQYLGYVRTSLEQIARDHGKQTAASLASELRQVIGQVSRADQILQKIGQQLAAWEKVREHRTGEAAIGFFIKISGGSDMARDQVANVLNVKYPVSRMGIDSVAFGEQYDQQEVLAAAQALAKHYKVSVSLETR